jgi:hypothetical protein
VDHTARRKGGDGYPRRGASPQELELAVDSDRAGGRALGDAHEDYWQPLSPDPTGIYPVQQSDPAYEYATNPNAISGYELAAALPADPAARR